MHQPCRCDRIRAIGGGDRHIRRLELAPRLGERIGQAVVKHQPRLVQRLDIPVLRVEIGVALEERDVMAKPRQGIDQPTPQGRMAVPP